MLRTPPRSAPPATSAADLGLRPAPWTERASCAQVGPDLFFPETGGSTEAAKAVCARCPVKAPCLEAALRRGERYGVWGGTSERQRRRLAERGTP